jgi:hypothetical protein
MRYRGKSRIWQLAGVAAIAAIGESEEKHEPASDINTVVVDSLKRLSSPRRKLGQWPPG